MTRRKKKEPNPDELYLFDSAWLERMVELQKRVRQTIHSLLPDGNNKHEIVRSFTFAPAPDRHFDIADFSDGYVEFTAIEFDPRRHFSFWKRRHRPRKRKVQQQ